MKLLFDFLPIILFFIVFRIKGIYWATGAAMAVSILQILITIIRKKKVGFLLWLSLAIIMVFGGATLLLHNEIFIKWKPTVLYWTLGLAFLISTLAFKKNLIRTLLETEIKLPETVWKNLNTAWMIFFSSVGAINLLVAYTVPTTVWVSFKLFGVLGLMLVFVLIQSRTLAKYLPAEETPPTGLNEKKETEKQKT